MMISSVCTAPCRCTYACQSHLINDVDPHTVTMCRICHRASFSRLTLRTPTWSMSVRRCLHSLSHHDLVDATQRQFPLPSTLVSCEWHSHSRLGFYHSSFPSACLPMFASTPQRHVHHDDADVRLSGCTINFASECHI